MHKFMLIGNTSRISHNVFKKIKEKVIAKLYINSTLFHVLINIICIVRTIWFILGMNLKNIIGRWQVRKSIKQNNQGHYKSGKWSGNSNIKILNFGRHSATKTNHGSKGTNGIKNGWKRNIVRQRRLDFVIHGREVVTKLVHRQNQQKRNGILHTTNEIIPGKVASKY